MKLQTRDLVMLALGAEGLYPELEDGVHLRWQMDLDLGFPPYGFDLFRRPHQPPVLVPVSAQALPDGIISLAVPCRAVRLRLRWPGGAGEGLGRFAGETMSSVALAGPAGAEVVLELAADALDEVQVLPGTVVLQAQVARVSTGALTGWGPPLNGAHRIGLPLSDAAYAVTHAHAPDDWAEAAARLSRRTAANGPVTLPPELASRFGGPPFQALQAVLRNVGANGPSPFPVQASGAGSPRMAVNPAALLGLLAGDPDFARILGLLRVDPGAVAGTRYDYKVIGYWTPGTTRNLVSCARFSEHTPGTSIEPGTTLPLTPVKTTTAQKAETGRHANKPQADEPPTADLRVTLQGVPANQVVEAASPWGHDRGLQLLGDKGQLLHLVIDGKTSEVILHVSWPGENLPVLALNAHGQPVEITTHQEKVAGEYAAIQVIGSGIVSIVVDGPRFTFFGVCTTTQVITGDTREWISFGVARSVPPALEAPQAVAVSAVPQVDPDDSPLLNPAAIRGRHGLAAALTWDLPTATATTLSRGAIAYHISRLDLGNGASPNPLPPGPSLAGFNRITEDRSGPGTIPVPVKPAKVQVPRSRPAGWPSTPVHYVDESASQRWYAYAVQGVDVFGRLSPPTKAMAELKDLLPPPPPSSTGTTFVDGALTPGDPGYSAALQAMIPSGADSLLLVDWEWSPANYRTAPDVAEFRVYWQPTRLNALTGTVTTVANQGDTSNVRVTLDGATLHSKMTDGWLRVGADFFRIVTSTTGAAPTLTVKNLRMTRTQTGAPTPPPTGRCSISIGGGDGAGVGADPNHVDYRNAARWATRIAAVPMVQPFTGRITGVAAHSLSGSVASNGWHNNGDGTSSVALNRSLRKAESLLRGGTLSIQGAAYTVLANQDGPAAMAVVQNTGPGVPPAPPNPLPSGAYTLAVPGLQEVQSDLPASALTTATAALTLAGGTLVTAGGEFRVVAVYASGVSGQLAFVVQTDGAMPAPGACSWFPGYQYAAVPQPPLAVGQQASVSGAVGVSSVDERVYVADTRGDAARTGNEGAVSAPMLVTRQRRGPVAAPNAPASSLPVGQSHIYASAPDYHGRSFYTVTWTGASGITTILYRALDDGVFVRDREQRRALSGYYAGRTPFDDDTGFQAWFTTYAASVPGLSQAQLTAPDSTLSNTQRAAVHAAWEAWATRFYPALDDTALQALANRAGNETAFVRLNAEPVRGASYADTLDGRAPSRFFYRTRAVDVAGNESPLSPCGLPVYIPVVLPPARPVLLEAAGGELSITLRWMENAEPDLDGYHLYRATSAADAEDIRSMTLHKRIARSPGAVLRAGEVAPSTVSGAAGRLEFTDNPLTPKVPFFYRVVAINTAERQSLSSAPIQGMAIDAPPPAININSTAWAPTSSGLAVRVTWSPVQRGHVRVQRRAQGSVNWTGSGTWLGGATGSVDLLGAEPHLSQEFRIETRNESGDMTTIGPASRLGAAVD